MTKDVPALQRGTPTCSLASSQPRSRPSPSRQSVPPGVGQLAEPLRVGELTLAYEELAITAAARRATPVVLDVLTRYPRAPKGHTRVAVLKQRLNSLLRDPPATPRVVDDPGPFFHGTKADLGPGDFLTPDGARTTVRGVRPNTSPDAPSSG